MTVIVYRNGVMASDSASFQGDNMTAWNVKKVFKVRGHLIGITGVYATGRKFIENFRRTGKLDLQMTTPEVTMLVVTPRRRVLLFKDKYVESLDMPFVVSGADARIVAMGALHMGATARRAVQIAIKVGPWAGGKVQSVKL